MNGTPERKKTELFRVGEGQGFRRFRVWQRGSNENTNGLLRQYFPKGTNLNAYGPEDLEHVYQQLNSRPRKTLGWDAPAQRVHGLLLAS